MKIVASIGLLFFAYCLVQVVAKWKHRDATERTIWLIVIAVGGGWCVSAFLPVPTAKALAWPSFLKYGQNNSPGPMTETAISLPPSPPPIVPSTLPGSIAKFLEAIDALRLANDRPVGISGDENVLRVRHIFRDTIQSSQAISRAELNTLYPGLGDNYFDYALRHMQLIVEAVDTHNQETMTQAMGSYVSWQRWWQQNASAVNDRIISRYSP